MFPVRYFAPRYFAPRYWNNIGAVAVIVVPSVVVPVTPILLSLYASLFDKLNLPRLNLNLLTSGFQDSEVVPYGIITKVSTNLITLDTCLDRLEDNLFQITIFEDNFTQLGIKLNTVEDILDFNTLTLSNRKINNVQFNGRIIEELTEGFYQGILTYNIVTQKDSSSNTNTSTTSGKNIYEALFNRYLSEGTLNNLIENFTTTAFGNEDWNFNFVYIPDYTTSKDFLTTCSRLEKTTFSISIHNDRLWHTEEVLEAIDDTFSYCKLKIDDKRFTSLKWLGNSIIEIEKNFWLGSVNYELILEKDIV